MLPFRVRRAFAGKGKAITEINVYFRPLHLNMDRRTITRMAINDLVIETQGSQVVDVKAARGQVKIDIAGLVVGVIISLSASRPHDAPLK